MFEKSVFVIYNTNPNDHNKYDEVKFWEDLTTLEKAWHMIQHPKDSICEIYNVVQSYLKRNKSNKDSMEEKR